MHVIFMFYKYIKIIIYNIIIHNNNNKYDVCFF